jgi:hypothetical protein
MHGMDDSALRAMARWPNVPSVYGWLSLDRRGRWRIKGELVSHREFVSCINRSYDMDPQGCWYFQNGPQRVFVRLEYLPIIVHLEFGNGPAPDFMAHTGHPVGPLQGVWLDEGGSVVLQLGSTAALLLDRDLEQALHFLEDGAGMPASTAQVEAFLDGAGSLYFAYREIRHPLGRIHSSEIPRRFSFNPDPGPAAGDPDC